jgi:poly(A) polymerase
MIIDATWLPWADIKRIATLLDGKARLVGGCVRDAIIGKATEDIDIATPLLPQEVMQRLQAGGVHCIPTGIAHGTITALIKHKPYEITTLRRDEESHGRHASVSYTDCWIEDSQRRDFTFNALYMDMDGKIYDYHDGRKDLNNKLVRFIGDPKQRIEEDYLRILRFFRFQAYFDGTKLDEPGLKACSELKEGVTRLSAERIHKEMFKLLEAPNAKNSLLAMEKAGILHYISIPESHNIRDVAFANNAVVNLAALLPNVTSAEIVASAWKLSKQQRKILINLIKYSSKVLPGYKDDAIYYDYLYRNGLEELHLLFDLLFARTGADVFKEHKHRFDSLEYAKFPIKGQTLMEKGLEKESLGAVMEELRQKWIDSGFTLTETELLKIYEEE